MSCFGRCYTSTTLAAMASNGSRLSKSLQLNDVSSDVQGRQVLAGCGPERRRKDAVMEGRVSHTSISLKG
jgi:hypothetical protein